MKMDRPDIETERTAGWMAVWIPRRPPDVDVDVRNGAWRRHRRAEDVFPVRIAVGGDLDLQSSDGFGEGEVLEDLQPDAMCHAGIGDGNPDCACRVVVGIVAG